MRQTLERVETEMVSCIQASPVYLSTVELVDSVQLAAQLHSDATVLLAQLVNECAGRDLPKRVGATSATAWLRETTRISNATASRVVSLGKVLTARPALVRAAVDGRVNAEQAARIGDTVDTLTKVEIAPTGADLSTKVPPALLNKAEKTLIDFASFFEPNSLGTLGDRIISHVAPEVGDRADAAALKRQEATARVLRRLHLSPSAGGRVRISGWLDTESAAHVSAALDPLSKPLPGDDGPDPRSAGQRRADALVEVCQHASKAPVDGGERPQVVVTVAYDPLRQRLGMGAFDLGGTLAPEAVRRIACDAHIIPAVLGGAGQPLDVGRTKRLVVGALRRALNLRDGGCAFPGCDRPSRWAQGHHIVHWADGGPTSLHNSVLLCGHHHRLIHRGEWQVRMADDGLPEFLPPAYIDRQRRPRRNIYHRRT
jgi:hypothetical protein